MICEHKGCEKEAEINICHDHINEDYPSNFDGFVKELKQELKEEEMTIQEVIDLPECIDRNKKLVFVNMIDVKARKLMEGD